MLCPNLLAQNPSYGLLWDSISRSPNDRAKVFVTLLIDLWHVGFFSMHCCFVGEHRLFKLAMPSSLGPSSVAAALQEALENSARLIDRHLQEDRCFPDLSELLNVPSHSKSPAGRHSLHTVVIYNIRDVNWPVEWVHAELQIMLLLDIICSFCRYAFFVRCVWHGLPSTRPWSCQRAKFTRAECRPPGPSAPGVSGAV